ncbi:MAG: S-layer protein, partial [Methanomicrobia archaeon]|nr:S-layer protein [Methanomicrobia archaeon]
IHDAVTIKPCCPDGFQWSLDVIRDVDIEYWDGNPYYGETDDYSPNDKTPDFSDNTKENVIALKLMNSIDIRIAGAIQLVPLCKFEIPEYGIDDFWVNSEDAPRYLELTIDDSGDLNHTDLVITKGFSVTYYTQETKHVKIDPMPLIVNDDEVTETMKATKNLVLVGGPGLVETPQGAKTCNILTKKLCDDGLSTVNWFYSVGEYEYIANAFTEDKDVIIVAGKDREATQKAVEKLSNDLNI